MVLQTIGTIRRLVFAHTQPWQVAVVAFIISVCLVGAHSFKFAGDLSGFICVGDKNAHPFVEDDILIYENSWGYDGQFFYLSAYDPLLVDDSYQYLDSPPYRSQRLAYPLLVYLSSFGQPRLFPVMLILVNLVAISLGVLFLGSFLSEQGKPTWWALVLALNGGVMLGVFRDLSEPLSMGLIIGSLWFQYRRLVWLSAVFMTLAVLTRESLILIPFIAFFAYAFKSDWRSAVITIIPGLIFVMWQLYIYYRLGSIPLMSGHGNFGMPFDGMIAYFQKLIQAPLSTVELSFFMVVVLMLIASIGVTCKGYHHTPWYLTVLLMLYTIMAFFFSDKIWVEPWSYGRVLLPQQAILLVYLARSTWRYERLTYFLFLISFVTVFVWILR